MLRIYLTPCKPRIEFAGGLPSLGGLNVYLDSIGVGRSDCLQQFWQQVCLADGGQLGYW